jgi:hypothetical protein
LPLFRWSDGCIIQPGEEPGKPVVLVSDQFHTQTFTEKTHALQSLLELHPGMDIGVEEGHNYTPMLSPEMLQDVKQTPGTAGVQQQPFSRSGHSAPPFPSLSIVF